MQKLRDFEDYARAEDRLQEISGEFAAADRRVAKLENEHRIAQQSSRAARIDDEAAALINGDGVAVAEKTIAQLRDEQMKVRDRRDVLRRAMEMQKDVLEKIRAKRGAEICESMLDAHRANVARIIAAVIELSRANVAEEEFLDAFRAEGIAYSGHLRSMRVGRIGRLNDPNSWVRTFLKEAEEYGFNVPKIKEAS